MFKISLFNVFLIKLFEYFTSSISCTITYKTSFQISVANFQGKNRKLKKKKVRFTEIFSKLFGEIFQSVAMLFPFNPSKRVTSKPTKKRGGNEIFFPNEWVFKCKQVLLRSFQPAAQKRSEIKNPHIIKYCIYTCVCVKFSTPRTFLYVFFW